jgi:uncharacterized protein (TIGR03067 family)
MKQVLLAGVVCALFAIGARAQEQGKTDEEKIQGTWSFVSVEKGGIDVNDDFVKDAKVTITVDRVKIAAGGKDMEAGYKLDASKKPKHMDIVISDGGKELVLKGIYALDGDELKVCFGGPADNRPTEFKSAGGSNEQMVVMKRDKQ